VKAFLNAEEQMILKLEEEKERLYRKPDQHQDYGEQWRNFYDRKCNQMGRRVSQHEVHAEWVSAWKDYFYAYYNRMKKEETNKLLNVHKVRKTG